LGFFWDGKISPPPPPLSLSLSLSPPAATAAAALHVPAANPRCSSPHMFPTPPSLSRGEPREVGGIRRRNGGGVTRRRCGDRSELAGLLGTQPRRPRHDTLISRQPGSQFVMGSGCSPSPRSGRHLLRQIQHGGDDGCFLAHGEVLYRVRLELFGQVRITCWVPPVHPSIPLHPIYRFM